MVGECFKRLVWNNYEYHEMNLHSVKEMSGNNESPRVTIARDWFKGASIFKLVEILIPMAIFAIIAVELILHNEPHKYSSLFLIASIYFLILIYLRKLIRKILPASFTLTNEKVQLKRKYARELEIPLNESTRIVIFRKNESESFSPENTSGYVFIDETNTKHHIFITDSLGWQSEDIARLFGPFIEIGRSGRCRILEDDLKNYLKCSETR
jgi:hypothetical protein